MGMSCAEAGQVYDEDWPSAHFLGCDLGVSTTQSAAPVQQQSFRSKKSGGMGNAGASHRHARHTEEVTATYLTQPSSCMNILFDAVEHRIVVSQ